eukprot:gnl/MRDRNA2_/MRDRNA2_75408_c0_seq1.p1 gnl/MRDRNA2_/MRDRNA2_75408_c0~~gnl/MRDRNA2_/MRDRNA2_75408_c0_seq1.p1  ORF type:complete len:447 (-),score=50.22 gnl/MRDRNA2_/MRDRNA2_75408_c0_seq1:122-1462(-)
MCACTGMSMCARYANKTLSYEGKVKGDLRLNGWDYLEKCMDGNARKVICNQENAASKACKFNEPNDAESSCMKYAHLVWQEDMLGVAKKTGYEYCRQCQWTSQPEGASFVFSNIHLQNRGVTRAVLWSGLDMPNDELGQKFQVALATSRVAQFAIVLSMTLGSAGLMSFQSRNWGNPTCSGDKEDITKEWTCREPCGWISAHTIKPWQALSEVFVKKMLYASNVQDVDGVVYVLLKKFSESSVFATVELPALLGTPRTQRDHGIAIDQVDAPDDPLFYFDYSAFTGIDRGVIAVRIHKDALNADCNCKLTCQHVSDFMIRMYTQQRNRMLKSFKESNTFVDDSQMQRALNLEGLGRVWFICNSGCESNFLVSEEGPSQTADHCSEPTSGLRSAAFFEDTQVEPIFTCDGVQTACPINLINSVLDTTILAESWSKISDRILKGKNGK